MCRSDYLDSEDLKEGVTIVYKGEEIKLIERAGQQQTFIDESNDEDDVYNIKIDSNANVYIRQRWKVVVKAKNKFEKDFITHRYINSFYCSYSELIKIEDKIYTAWEVLPNNNVDNNQLPDRYDGLY